ncbi:MAG: hypothetical protein U9R34_04320 [Nanoarchaeota archaeon]|nr:hypothetical protein [Nanoarchaeota archaeon]
MVSITVPLDDKLFVKLKQFSWVNWSEVAREKLMKREIFDKYIKTKKISKEDERFCEEIDWHPVDELPLKKEFIERLKKAQSRPDGKSMTPEEFNKWCEEL